MSVLIKRYANRKLYNTQTSRYITLKGIAELVESGEDVTVIDNETGEDITSVALSQILVDSERSNRPMSRTLLSGLIQRGGDALYGALRKGVDDASEGIEEVRRNVRRLVRARDDDGKLTDWIALSTPDVDHLVQNAMERVFKLLDLPRRSDIEALTINLQRVADAVERLETGRPTLPTSPASDHDPITSTNPPKTADPKPERPGPRQIPQRNRQPSAGAEGNPAAKSSAGPEAGGEDDPAAK